MINALKRPINRTGKLWGGVALALLCLSVGGHTATGQAANEPSLRVSPGTLAPGEKFTIAGFGFKAGEAILFYWGKGLLSGTVGTNRSGAFSGAYQYTPTKTAPGTHYIKATGVSSHLSASVAVNVPAPTAAITPLAAAPRQQLTLSGSGFGAYETVSILWDAATTLGTTKANSHGVVSGHIYVPANAPGGSHVVLIKGAKTGINLTVALAVTALAPTQTPIVVPATPKPLATVAPSGPPIGAGVYHFSGSLVPTLGAQVSHVDGILTLQVGPDGNLAGSALRLNTGGVVPMGGSGAHGLVLSFTALGLSLSGQSSAVAYNRLSGLFSAPNGGTNGFWVATRIAPAQQGVRYTFSGKVDSGPDAGTTYDGALELYGDTYGGLLGYLTLRDGTLLRVDGQSVNGNVNMLVVVRAGTPLFASGTMMLGGNLRGTIAGPLAGDQGSWTASK